ncbi:MotA/TolQ/ExbB proton channel family protein [Devosia sp. A369]
MAAPGKLTDKVGNRAYDKVALWLLLAGLVVLGLVVGYDYGFLQYLFAADSSHVSVLIAILFAGFSLYCLATIVQFSSELHVAKLSSHRLDLGELASVNAGVTRIGDYVLPRGWVGEHLSDILLKRSRDPNARPGVLLDAFISQFRSRARFGIYGSDVLYKLGMLGTVIGFIQMLSTMDGIAQFDPETLRTALRGMTGGMATALLTTVAGLVCGLILRIQFNLLEGVAADVIKSTVRIGDIYLAPLPMTDAHV